MAPVYRLKFVYSEATVNTTVETKVILVPNTDRCLCGNSQDTNIRQGQEVRVGVEVEKGSGHGCQRMLQMGVRLAKNGIHLRLFEKIDFEKSQIFPILDQSDPFGEKFEIHVKLQISIKRQKIILQRRSRLNRLYKLCIMYLFV